MRQLIRATALCLVALMGAQGALAQSANGTATDQHVLVVNLELLFSNSILGQRIKADLDRVAREAQQENDRLRIELEAEERTLTEQRKQMSVEDFRAAAQAFDQKVQSIRAERDAKEVEIAQMQQSAQAQFNAQVRDVIGQVMLERGGAVVLDGRSIYLARSSVDITNDVIARLNTLTQQAEEQAE